MKRLCATLLATVIGFGVALFLSDFTRLNHWPEKPYHGCYEIDACNVPWWVLTIFALWFLGPPVIHGCVAYVGFGRKWSTVRWITTGSILLLGMAAFYLSWHAYRAFV